MTEQKLINVEKVDEGKGNFAWYMSYGTEKGGPGNYPEVKVTKGTNADFQFNIVNTPDVTFSQDPIWIRKGAVKPNKSGVDKQIEDVTGQNTTVLKFHDTNKDQGILTYRLNFSDGSKLDPIIRNGGAGPGGVTWMWYALGAVALVAILVLVIRPMLLRRGASQPKHGASRTGRAGDEES